MSQPVYDEGARFAFAAATMVGCPFRLHGRDPGTGIDCVGLIICALRAIGRSPLDPRGYSLRVTSPDRWMECATASGFGAATGERQAGDLLMSAPGAGQYHLMVCENRSAAIHAHAGLRRVVRQPIDRSITIKSHWRLASSRKG